MIKKNIIATISVVALFLTSCDGVGTKSVDQTPAVPLSSGGMSIAYVDIDSVVTHYELFEELNGKYVKNAEKVQKELERRATAFQKKQQVLQNKMNNGMITRTGAEEEGQKLYVEQQEIVQYRDEQIAKLSEEEMVMRNTITYNIKEYVNKYNEVKKYDLILSTSAATGTVIAANPSFDISDEIAKGLNEEHAKKSK